MPTIDTNSSFNIEGDNLEKGKSQLDFSALHIFDVLETPYTQNSALLSAIEQEKDIYIIENQNSFLITDEYFQKPLEKPIPVKKERIDIPKVENKATEMIEEKTIVAEKVTETPTVQPIEAETEDKCPEMIEEKIAKIDNTPTEIFEENITIIEVEKVSETPSEKVIEEEPAIFISEKVENISNEVQPEFAILEKTEPHFSENISKNEEENKKSSKKDVFLHKKKNLLVKIIVKEDELAQYFEPKEHFSFTETDNMSPETTSIIDRFLENEPKLTRSRIDIGQKNTPVQDLLQQDEDEIVTETMAYLYASQGNKIEAIRIYKKLSLQFPEKSDYFAARIKAVIS